MDIDIKIINNILQPTPEGPEQLSKNVSAHRRLKSKPAQENELLQREIKSESEFKQENLNEDDDVIPLDQDSSNRDDRNGAINGVTAFARPNDDDYDVEIIHETRNKAEEPIRQTITIDDEDPNGSEQETQNEFLTSGPSVKNGTGKTAIGSAKENRRKSTTAGTYAVREKWTWTNQQTVNHSDLYFELCQRPNIKELNIQAGSADSWTDGLPELSPSEREGWPLDLPYLKRLKIRHDGEINYGPALKEIIAASNLENIDIEYLGDQSLRVVLTTLKAMDETQLQSLKYLSIDEANEEKVALVPLELELLSEVKARNLEKLSLGLYLWQEKDTKKSFEAVLQNFSGLKHLTIKGCFITDLETDPKFTVNFPVMPQLEILDLGKQYKFDSVFETIDTIPKRRRSSIRIRPEDSNEVSHSPAPRKRARRDSDEDVEGRFFRITLDIPAMPKLKTAMIGLYYDIQDLHFARFPALTVFQVSSPWHLSVKFPSSESRHRTYPRVTQLQLPDGLEDHTFVAKVATHFPNVETYRINLPSVKVLRAFSKVQLSLNPLRLKKLDLKVRFDFPCSLDWSFLEKPSEQRSGGVALSDEEKEKIAQLKSYQHWDEYAKSLQIEVPNTEELTAMENETEFRGLGALCKHLRRALTLNVEYIPRTLRIPKGALLWDDETREFSNVIIGYRSMEYPFSNEAWELTPNRVFINHFKRPEKAKAKCVEDTQVFFQVDTSSSSRVGPPKKDEDSSLN